MFENKRVLRKFEINGETFVVAPIFIKAEDCNVSRHSVIVVF